jgi:hypothetical protein
VQKDTKPVVLGLVGDSEATQATIANSLIGQPIWQSFKAPGRPTVAHNIAISLLTFSSAA